ncbi:MAG: hypothetical protein JRF18_05335, partial [Deltaproteobacteria bacterium]|nr:hypothetical protein [Deltaproteobacteria bacterium]
MPNKKEKKESSLNPEISRELHKLQFANQRMSRAEKASRHREECSFEQAQRARIKDVQLKILKDEHYDKHKKADRKIGGVRGKFHPSLERTR